MEKSAESEQERFQNTITVCAERLEIPSYMNKEAKIFTEYIQSDLQVFLAKNHLLIMPKKPRSTLISTIQKAKQ